MHREYWGECSSATLWQPVGVSGDKKENKLIQMSYKYDITNTNVKKSVMHVQSGCFDCHSIDVAVVVAF